MRDVFVLLAGALAVAPSAPVPAGAGTCVVVINLEASQGLNLRARPSSASRAVDVFVPGSEGALRLDSPCVPTRRAWEDRWCPVSHQDADRVTKGWIRARYVSDTACP